MVLGKTPSARTAGQFFVWFVAALALSVALYARLIDAFFISDEISLATGLGSWAGKGWGDCFRPFTNGFLRPTAFLFWKACLDWGGLTPWVWHGAALVVHAAVAAVTGLLALRMPGGRPWRAWLAVGLMTAHLGGWHSAVMLSCTCDSLLALGLLVGLLCWDCWLERGGWRWLAGLGVACVFALGAKETSIVFPFMMALWSLACSRKRMGLWRVVTAIGLLSVAWAALCLALQLSYASYLATGQVVFSVKNFIKLWTAYGMGAFIPFLSVVEWPWGLHVYIPNAVTWGLRLATLGVGAAAAVVFVRRPAGSRIAALLLMIAMLVALPSLRAGNPEARYLYSALPLACLVLVEGLGRLRGPARAGLGLVVGVMWLLFIAGFYTAPSILAYQDQARRVERFIQCAQAESKDWPAGATISIYDHPHQVGNDSNWVYCQLLFNLFLPEKHPALVMDAITPQTTRAYRFDGERLVEMEF